MMAMNEIFSGLENVINGDGIKALKTPCYVIDEKKLLHNAEVLSSVMSHTGCRILLAQKAFSNYDFYPLLSKCLSGTEASGSVSVSSVWGTVMMTPACSPFSRVTIVPSVSDPPHAESIRAVNMVAVAVISFLSI